MEVKIMSTEEKFNQAKGAVKEATSKEKTRVH